MVIEENHSRDEILGSGAPAPYIQSLANMGVDFIYYQAIEHPSQPNYLDLFSGDNQGTTDSDDYPSNTPFSTPNLGAQLRSAGLSFAGYSQGLPQVGSLVETYSASDLNEYVHKHNPWANWQSDLPGPNQLPPQTNQPFTNFPTNFSLLPTVSFVVPDEQNDMHDGSIQQGDAWLRANLDRYYQWAQLHNSLLIVTWDEDDESTDNQIPTIFAGPMIRRGADAEAINHFSVLRTIEDMYGLSHIAQAANATTITGAFYSGPRQWLAGDTNFDGTVDAGDFATLASHFNDRNQSWMTGDFSGDGVVNALDFNALASNFGRTAALPGAGLSAAVPEPQCAIAFACSMFVKFRRRSALRADQPAARFIADRLT